jgi:uncharacterized iron-regulated protein
MRSLFYLVCALSLTACLAPSLKATLAAPDAALPDVLLLGEQHDAPAHRNLQRNAVSELAARGRLAAVALEMVDQGRSTAALDPKASEDAVRTALDWNSAGWDWPTYSPVVLTAVRAGVPVIGANLPRSRLREAMANSELDGLLPGPALKAQQQAIRAGHCDLLPETQIMPMTRVQIARDRTMAQVLLDAAKPGMTVLLVAGAGHVDPALGVPRYLPANLKIQAEVLPPHASGKDYCAEMRSQMKRTAPAK